ncbi:MAG: PAS domain S-box protein [Sporomusaceae bacterium]|nr:PAS domain S-box protein [Sporomusaceae bacterium]
MYDLSVRNVSTNNLAEVMEDVLDIAIILSEADMGTLQLWDNTTGGLKIAAQRGFAQPFLDFFADVRAGQGAVCGEALALRQRVVVEDVGKKTNFVGTPNLAVMQAAGVGAVQSTLLVSREGRLVGMLTTHYRAPRPAADMNLAFFDLLASQAADIIAQVQAQQALKTSEEKYRQLFESMNEGFAIIEMVFDDDGRPVDYIMRELNPAWERQAGISKERILGKRVTEFLPVVEPVWFERYGEVVTSGEAKIFEEYNVSLDRWYEVHAYPLHRDNRFAVIFTDITERKQLELKLREHHESLERLVEERTRQLERSERLYRTLVENIPITICRMDRDYRYRYLSPATEKDYGTKGEQIIGKSWDELGYDEAKVGEWRKCFEQAAETGMAVKFEFELSDNKTGSQQYYEAQVVTEKDELGKVESFLIVSENVTTRKLMEQQLRHSERHYRTLVENLPVFISRYDKDLRFIYRSLQGETYKLGRENTSVVGRTWADLGVPETTYRPWQKKFNEALSSGRILEFETQYPNQNGEIRDLLLRIVPEKNGAGQVESLLSVGLDVTERKRTESELMRLDRLNLVGEMAAAIGHEVRNPMTTVRGYLQMLERKQELAGYGEQFRTMIGELDRANVIISDFLSLAKNKAVALESRSLNEIIDALLPLLRAEALRTGYDIQADLGEVPAIQADDKEIRQLILNLARNAFEAMETGGRLTIATGAEAGRVVLTVRDTGHGMPQELVDKLGTPFVTTKENGTGLGLPVCYRIAERHGGKIGVQTSPSGTTFKIIF